MSDDGEVYDHTVMRDHLFIEHYRGQPVTLHLIAMPGFLHPDYDENLESRLDDFDRAHKKARFLFTEKGGAIHNPSVERWYVFRDYPDWMKDRYQTRARVEWATGAEFLDQYTGLPEVRHEGVDAFLAHIGWNSKSKTFA
jgi:hypothetical protein